MNNTEFETSCLILRFIQPLSIALGLGVREWYIIRNMDLIFSSDVYKRLSNLSLERLYIQLSNNSFSHAHISGAVRLTDVHH